MTRNLKRNPMLADVAVVVKSKSIRPNRLTVMTIKKMRRLSPLN